MATNTTKRGARVRITKREVDRLSGHRRRLWDAELVGFGVRVNPGGTKSYSVSYGTGKEGQNTTATIGRHGAPWTPETARQETRRLLGLVVTGCSRWRCRGSTCATFS